MLRDLTQRMGIIHEAQALQIRNWPFAVDPEIDKAQAILDVEGKTLHYEWQAANRKAKWSPDASYRKRLKALSGGVAFLLGPGWKMSVAVNGKSIFSMNEENGQQKRKPRPAKRVTKRGKRTKRR